MIKNEGFALIRALQLAPAYRMKQTTTQWIME